jgi:hypothetical protein
MPFSNNKSKVILSAALLFIAFQACKKDKAEHAIDREMLDMAKSTAGFTWYKFSSANLPKSSGSGHPQPLLRTRFNATAANHLDSLGKVIPGTQFTSGSLIVKELLGSGGGLERYAILYKNPGHEFADDKGWIWGYVDANGKIAEPAANKGAACISCHTQQVNIDYMLMNKFYP